MRRFFVNTHSSLRPVTRVIRSLSLQLRKTLDFTIVRLELLQSEVFNNGGGERTQLLTSFCDYQSKLNPGDDSHPEHWDIG